MRVRAGVKPGRNRTCVGLKRELYRLGVRTASSRNRTCVGLKPHLNKNPRPEGGGRNRTCVGLKRYSPPAAALSWTVVIVPVWD